MKKKDWLAVVLCALAVGAAIAECWWLYTILAVISVFMLLFICDK